MRSRRALLLLHSRFSRLFPTPSPPTIPRFFFSSKSDFSSENPILRQLDPTDNLSPNDDASIRKPKDDALIRKPIDDASTDANVDSTAELKKMISMYMAGDMEVLPSIFEAILLRKLSGEHEDTDNELMEEIRSRMPCTSDFVEKEGEGDEDDEDEDEDDEEEEDENEEEDVTSDDDSDASDEGSDYYSK